MLIPFDEALEELIDQYVGGGTPLEQIANDLAVKVDALNDQLTPD